MLAMFILPARGIRRFLKMVAGHVPNAMRTSIGTGLTHWKPRPDCFRLCRRHTRHRADPWLGLMARALACHYRAASERVRPRNPVFYPGAATLHTAHRSVRAR